MKFAEKIFPLGTFPDQRTDGAYINQTLAENLNIYAKKIAKDMHFLGIITGNDSVGNGKSTFATQIGAYLTNRINEIHGINNTFTADNIHFNTTKLIKKSLSSPKLSVQMLDEGDDLTTHHAKELAVKLKRYFRKCRQLNQIVILILPSFFELPKFFALARSHFLINVSFEKEFERGFFKFYGPTNKKLLYLKGKKYWDYTAHPPSFDGVFFSSYCFFPNVEEQIKIYLKRKHEDIQDDAQFEEESMSKYDIEKELKINLFRQIIDNTKILQKDLAVGFGVSERTATRWMNERNDSYFRNQKMENGLTPSNINNTIVGEDVDENSERFVDDIVVKN